MLKEVRSGFNMKNSYDLEGQIDAKYQMLLNYDKREIDNPDKYQPCGFYYLDKLKTVISIIKREFPAPDQVRIGDFACAQGNISLILAESGYEMSAIDINPTFIEYSKMKYEKGKIEWIVGSIESLNFPAEILDVAIAGELLEHCAYPEEIMEKILGFVRPGGLLILTTPNGSKCKTSLPTFKQVSSKEQRKMFEERQFGPVGKHHLFLFKLKEIQCILPPEAEIIDKGYLGGTTLMNRYTKLFCKLFPLQFVQDVNRVLSKVPVINTKTFNNIYVVLRKVTPANNDKGKEESKNYFKS